MPDGTPRKLLDISRITKLGWNPRTKLDDGIKYTYHFLKEYQNNTKFKKIFSKLIKFKTSIKVK